MCKRTKTGKCIRKIETTAALIVKTTLIQSRASLYVETCQTGIGVVYYLSVSLLKVVFALEK